MLIFESTDILKLSFVPKLSLSTYPTFSISLSDLCNMSAQTFLLGKFALEMFTDQEFVLDSCNLTFLFLCCVDSGLFNLLLYLVVLLPKKFNSCLYACFLIFLLLDIVRYMAKWSFLFSN